MDKREFLDILRSSLSGEVNADMIEQNIRYYDQYITSKSTAEEEKIIKILGDPRLIAKTIIESDKAAKLKGKGASFRNDNSSYNTNNYETDNINEKKSNKRFFTNMKWYHKAVAYVVVLLILVIIFAIVISVARLLIILAVPILLMLLLYSLFKRR